MRPQKSFFATFIMSLSLLLLVCSCNDKENEGPKSGKYSVEMEISYTPEYDTDFVEQVEVSWTSEGETYNSVTLSSGQSWSKTIVVSEIPAVVGFIATSQFADDIPAGATFDITEAVKCTIVVKDGDNIVDFREFEDNETSTVESDLIDDTTIWCYDCLYKVTDTEIRRISLDELEEEDETIPGSMPEIPSQDTDEVKAPGTLYYFSRADVDEDPDCLCDNLIARFNSRLKWDGSVLGKGDFLFLFGSDIEKANVDVLRESLSRGTVMILDELASIDVLEGFCNATGTHNPLEGSDKEIAHTMFIVADADVNLAPEGCAPQHGFFFVLSPADENQVIESDFYQGGIIDRAVSKLNEIFTVQPNNSPLWSRAGEMDELTNLVSAYTVMFDTPSQTRNPSDYRNKKKFDSARTNHYSLEYNIWNVYDIRQKLNFYYIHMEFIGQFGPAYAGVYNCNVTTNKCHTIAKVCEWYADNVKIGAVLPEGKSTLHKTEPATTQHSQSYTSGMSYNFGGQIGFSNGKPMGSISAGLAVSNSHTYTVNDVDIHNECEPGAEAKALWTFDFAAPSVSFKFANTSQTKINEPPLSARKTFTAGSDFIFSYSGDSAPSIEPKLTVTLASICGKAGLKCGARSFDGGISNLDSFALPYLTASQFNN